MTAGHRTAGPRSTPICFAGLRGYGGFGNPPLPDQTRTGLNRQNRENTSTIAQIRAAQFGVDVVGPCCGATHAERAATHQVGVFSDEISGG